MRLVSASPRPLEPASGAPGDGVSSSGAAGAEARAAETALALRAQEGDVAAFAALVERRIERLIQQREFAQGGRLVELFDDA